MSGRPGRCGSSSHAAMGRLPESCSLDGAQQNPGSSSNLLIYGHSESPVERKPDEPEIGRGCAGPSRRSRSQAPRGNAVLAAPAARAATRRWSAGACSHAGAWEPEDRTQVRSCCSSRPSRSHAPRGNAVLAAPAARAAARRWSVGACPHAGAWGQEGLKGVGS